MENQHIPPPTPSQSKESILWNVIEGLTQTKEYENELLIE